jgi:hypothetical protein
VVRALIAISAAAVGLVSAPGHLGAAGFEGPHTYPAINCVPLSNTAGEYIVMSEGAVGNDSGVNDLSVVCPVTSSSSGSSFTVSVWGRDETSAEAVSCRMQRCTVWMTSCSFGGWISSSATQYQLNLGSYSNADLLSVRCAIPNEQTAGVRSSVASYQVDF